MSSKIEESLNLPPMEKKKKERKSKISDLREIQDNIDEIDKIDKALPLVKGLDGIDTELDGYAVEAMESYEKLMELGHNVEDRHAASIFDSANKMMQNAIKAKSIIMDKRLKIIKLQLDKAKLDKEAVTNSDTIVGEVEVLENRNEILQSIINQK